jgi:hypothetical protein
MVELHRRNKMKVKIETSSGLTIAQHLTKYFGHVPLPKSEIEKEELLKSLVETIHNVLKNSAVVIYDSNDSYQGGTKL